MAWSFIKHRGSFAFTFMHLMEIGWDGVGCMYLAQDRSSGGCM
jgi:hypothetical protein